jgi:hypothetical protein
MNIYIDINRDEDVIIDLPIVILPDGDFDNPTGGVYAPGWPGDLVRPVLIPKRRRIPPNPEAGLRRSMSSLFRRIVLRTA